MVHVFYIRCEGLLKPEVYEQLIARVPISMRTELMQYRDARDRQRSLLGKTLLAKGLEALKLEEYSLENIRYSEFGRPGFGDRVDFNISHSGIYTVCAIDTDGPVGTDVEKLRELAFGEFEEQLSDTEWDMVNASRVPQQLLFDLWTKKEAFLKSIGTGLSVFPGDVVITGPVIQYGEVVRYAQEVTLDSAYVCHVVTAQPGMAMTVYALSADDL